MENKTLNKVLIISTLLMIIIFTITLISLVIQTFKIESGVWATIIGGVLSMFGGMVGAFGAYLVASHQMNKQIEHEKKKEEKLRLTQIKKTLKKLQRLNEIAINFVKSFAHEFNKPFNEELSYKLKSSETAILWISNSINDVNDDLLNEGLMLDYIRYNHLVNHTYNEIIVFNELPEVQKAHNLPGFIVKIGELEGDFIQFEQYIKDQLEQF
ncbi:hypothetical protein ABIA69_001912 [Lysinibacillus parviboronicapiens]|uniref:Uncharacterized protein n=1 Tax=Lysinibacillus parviboronicapiens TaxID=436516 RepID=A0ABV2PIL0_9BACI